MKLWKIGLYICCALIILYWFFYRDKAIGIGKEGFQDASVPPITTMNVSYSGQYKETYLSAHNIPDLPTFIPLYDDTLNPDGTSAINMYAANDGVEDYDYGGSGQGLRKFYVDAYTFEEAQAKCADFGGVLASPAQLGIAAQLGGYWTTAGWASDRNRYAVIPQKSSIDLPNTMKWTVSGSSGSGSGSGSSGSGLSLTPPYDPLRRFIPGALPATGSSAGSGPAVQRAFPVCWGIKPVQPSMDVVDFNEMEYSMFTTEVIGYVTNPISSELLQVRFTPDQAVYALQQTNYNINDGGTNPARKFLIGDSGTTGFGNVNTQMYIAAAGSAQYNQDNTNLSITPCILLTNTFNNFQAQFNTLRQIMRDISGSVIAMEFAKEENADFQMSLETVCEIESPTTSPACARLATLDYDILYNTDSSDISTTRIATLELLNHNLYLRQGELCQAMQNLFAVQNILSCQSSSTLSPDCTCATDGSSPITGPSTLCTASMAGYNWSMNGLQENNVEYLRILLQQISPYFGVATYQSLIGGILDKLSVMIDMPNLNDFNTSADNFSAVDKEIKAIQAFLTYDRANTAAAHAF